MFNMTSNSRRWAAQISTIAFVSFAIFFFFCALFVWFANYDSSTLGTDRTQNEGASSLRSTSDKRENWILEEESMNWSSESTAQGDHQEELVRPVKLISELKSVPNDDNEAEETEYSYPYSGNFRQHDAKFWDLKPEYEFDAFGRRFHLMLRLNQGLSTPNLKVTYVSKNYSVHQEPSINPSGCFYTGFIKGEPDSQVAVSLCNGMRGHIISESCGYFIEPAETSNNQNADTFLHKLRPIRPKRTSSSANAGCSVRTDTEKPSTPDRRNTISEDDEFDDPSRPKRSVNRYTIELMIVVDKNVAAFHGDQLEHYILLLMNTVRSLFKSASIGTRINISVVNFTVLDDDLFRFKTMSKNSTLLNEFCSWQWKQRALHDKTNPHYDTAIFLTRDQICLPHQNDCNSAIGYALFGEVCHSSNSCAIVQENGFLTSFTIAHEIGHLLNIPHDEPEHCDKFQEQNNEKLMTKSYKKETDPWVWSACSKHHLRKFLQTKNIECLYNDPLEEFKPISETYLGEYYNKDKQCELKNGPGWTACSNDKKECDVLSCYNPRYYCLTDGRPWADGTPCGDGVNYWCKRKECVKKIRHMPVVHGGWGEWKPFGPCSRTCGGGITKSTRECDNPSPSETGDYCTGDFTRYKSCNTHECPPGIKDFRFQQCEKFNNETTRWVPYRISSVNDKCKLLCKVEGQKIYFMVEDVIDGTPCNQKSFGICVDGRCMKAGCDHILDSETALDNCGVCAGDNSTCREIRKEYYIDKPEFGFNYIDTIPAGSWDLNVRQYNRDNNKDSNYLTIKDPTNGAYFFNEKSLIRSASIIIKDNLSLDYTGVDAIPPERVTLSSRLPRNLVVEVKSLSNLTPFYVECRYKIANAQHYQWEITNEWSRCDKVCFGEQKRIIRCTKKETGNVVASESCSGLAKPESATKVCNEFCSLVWKEVNRTECSSYCGRGEIRLTYRCYQEERNTSETNLLRDFYCSHIEKPPEKFACTGPCDRVRWRYHDWEPCSVTCGTGIQTRRADCVDEHDVMVDESLCSQWPKKTQNICFMDECPRWSTSSWSACSVSCGRGYRKREYRCEKKNTVVSPNLCSSYDRPHDTEICQMAPCTPVWIVGEWSQCSVACGQGTVFRSVRCSDINEALCPQNDRPAKTQMCYLPNCSSTTTPDSNEILRHSTDNEKNYFKWRTGDWGECSTTCGKGLKQRLVECYDVNSKKAVDRRKCRVHDTPYDTESCEERPCAEWKISGQNPCPVACGQGTTYRHVWCVLNGKHVADSKCPPPKPDTIVPCDTYRPCPVQEETTSQTTEVSYGIWRTGQWGECSVSCGGGMKVRIVMCSGTPNSTSAKCLEQDKPSPTISCNSHPCPDQVKWKYGDWSQCTQTCDGGYQRRQAQCYTLHGESVADTYCNQKESPRLVRQCENEPCVKVWYQWKTLSWSECSATCGIGVQNRLVQCEKIDARRPENRQIVDDFYCGSASRPQTEKECQRESCNIDKFTYRWTFGAWTKCSVTCGRGFRKRRVSCEKVNEAWPNERETVSDNYCDDSTKPKMQSRCRRGLCNSEYMWISGPWGECRGPCGEKIKLRNVQCYHKSGKNVDTIFCHGLKRPNTRRRCKLKKCDPISCIDIKTKYGLVKDQDYIMNILGRNISIYCHEMNSDHPTEFLSLPAGEQENYSEFYPKRLLDPKTCPRSKYDCCVEERNEYVGRTMFSKIRLNVTTMQVLTSDYTFAKTLGSPVPYGEAGDCYSQQNCPQGTFSINLSGTGLQIASSVTWNKKGAYAHMDVREYNERRKIIGRCGGYCATCTAIYGIKLDVLPP